MQISIIFPAALLLWVASRMRGLRDWGDPYGRSLITGGLVIIVMLGLIIWHDLRFIVHS